MNAFTKTFVRRALPLLIIVGGAVTTWSLFASREKPQQQQVDEPATLVETRVVERQSHRLDVQGSGVVKPEKTVAVSPQVSGRVESVHPNMMPGGIVKKGETLFELDRDDYRIGVKRAVQALEQAKAKLAIERGQQDVAREEWEAYKGSDSKGKSKASPLALRKPQLQSAKAQVETARANLEKARLDLSRTEVKAPFDAVIQDESIDVGQMAGPQTPAVTLVGTDAFRVQMSIASRFIDDIAIPGVQGESKGSSATVEYDLGDNTIERTGTVIGLKGQLEPQGRMANVFVRLVDPLGLDRKDGDARKTSQLPLLLNSYVDVTVQGKRSRQLIEVPRASIENGDKVFVFSPEDKLAIAQIDVAWRRPETVLVESGLEEGQRIVTSPLANPIEGMELRRQTDGDQSTDERENSP